MTPVSSPIREFGILKVEHGDVRVAAWAAPWRTVRPAPHVPHDERGAEAREELPEIALRVGGGIRLGRQGERDDGDGEIHPHPASIPAPGHQGDCPGPA